MKDNYSKFKKIYRKSATEKLQEAFGIAVIAFVTIVIVAGIIGVDLV